MRLHYRHALGALLTLGLVAGAGLARAQESDTVSMAHDPAKYQIIVSATRTAKPATEIPNGAAVIRGEELRRKGARTLADALIDVTGLETGDGGDNGSRLPNVGMWGLKEFDAMLITVDGVPVGGPFNPSLAQIAVEDIDRIEVVKGPQGSMYGVSAFAGMIQVFTRGSASEGVDAAVGGGSFGDVHGRASMHHGSGAWNLDAMISGGRGDGWQDRTANQVMRGRVSLNGGWGEHKLAVDLVGLSDRQNWGTPVPFDAGKPWDGFDSDHNYAIGGARQDHGIWSLATRYSEPICKGASIRNVASITQDHQNSIRSFPGEAPDSTGTFGSEGVQYRPIETSFFEDLSMLSNFKLAGSHEFVLGGAVTWGRTKASGTGFDFDQVVNDASSIPNWDAVDVGDHRAFEDRRTFAGVYAHDTWTPVHFVSLGGGGRWDHVNEKLFAFGQEVGSDPAYANDARTDQAWSGDASALVRLIPENGMKDFSALNLYGNLKSSFKPAAPNLTEAEGARILDPERTHSIEGGLKGELWEGQFGFDASIFQMDFHNLVVSTLVGGLPALINAGHERFKGYEVNASIAPARMRGFSLSGGYAHHEPKFVDFTFSPDGVVTRNVSGKFIELAPQELYNAKIAYSPARWLGGWASLRHQGERPLTRRNSFWTPAFDEYDAGLTFDAPKFRVTVVGRNLGDDRHPVAESDIGDSMFYISAPRRFSGEVSFKF